jgi:hypothetical protein
MNQGNPDRVVGIVPERYRFPFVAAAKDVFSVPKPPDELQNLPSLLFSKWRCPFTWLTAAGYIAIR